MVKAGAGIKFHNCNDIEFNKMKYAIIAAGEGSRLVDEGVKSPKPLVKINGECLIDRLIRIFLQNTASEICVICNSAMTEVAEHLNEVKNRIKDNGQVTLNLIVKSTPSSMHSFFELSKFLGKEPFVLTTVDTIFQEEDFKDYIKSFHRALHENVDAFMGVTDFVDDEKPLYVGVEKELIVNGFFDKNDADYKYISGGIYGLTPRTISTLNRCISSGKSKMRNFQRALLSDGVTVHAYPFSKVLDIDHAQDIIKAEDFLKQ